MLDSVFVKAAGRGSLSEILVAALLSLLLGFVVSRIYMWRTAYSKNLAFTLILLPAMVHAVIFLVNGNLGTGLAVMGAFSLVRFRSVPGSAKEIACIFFAMAIGLATGMGYLVYGTIFTALVGGAMLLLTLLRYGEKAELRILRITIPEDLDYQTIFDDLFREYADRVDLERVKTTDLGSLFDLQYSVVLKRDGREKEFLDKLRSRNGNLSIALGRNLAEKDEL
jgi:hypothetical protein